MTRGILLGFLLLCGCVSTWRAPDEFTFVPVNAGEFEIATFQKITDPTTPIHIYIEGDGHAFNGRGMPTSDPTPHGTFMRDMAISDTAPNVVYIARPCQFIMSPTCHRTDWTTGRFSGRIVDAIGRVVADVAATRPIILIGYSGGAMVSGLVITRRPDLDVRKWITIAGVLNHADWTEYFGDAPLTESLNMTELPPVPQLHYVGAMDDTVPPELTYRMADYADIVVVPNATHGDFGELVLDFAYNPK